MSRIYQRKPSLFHIPIFSRINPNIESPSVFIDIKFTDRLAYYNAFDEYHVKHNLSAMEKLFAGYINERLDMYLAMLQER